MQPTMICVRCLKITMLTFETKIFTVKEKYFPVDVTAQK
jgi:hypothetical protein